MSLKLKKLLSAKSECAVSSVVEHYLDTVSCPERNAPRIGAFSRDFPPRSNKPPNKVPNTPRFQRVERALHRHVRSGELWFVGRRGGRVIWLRLRTPDLLVARATVAMMESQTNGNSAIYLVVDGKEQPVEDTKVAVPNQLLPQARQALVPVKPPATPTNPRNHTFPASPSTTGTVPILDDYLKRCRNAKAGLKSGTELKLDNHLKMLRRYVDASRPVTDYRPQDLRDYIAKARADKDSKGQRRLKGQTINESICRTLHEAFELALEEGMLARNPMTLVKREKQEPINRSQHKWADAERILEDVKARAHESYLELKFMLFMGVGQAEAEDLGGGSVDWEKEKITFIRRKTGKEYYVPIFPWANDFVRTEIQPRLKRGQPVFDWRNPRKALETACRKLEVESVDIRSLRRTLIIHLLENKMPPRLIAKWQGHKDATLIYKTYGAFIDAEYEEEALAMLGKVTAQK